MVLVSRPKTTEKQTTLSSFPMEPIFTNRALPNKEIFKFLQTENTERLV